MKLSVLLPTYRRPADLLRCLAALCRQTRPADQIVVVVRSDDLKTWEALADFPDCPLDVIAVHRPGVVHALNSGLAVVAGDAVAITDDDAAPHADWLDKIERAFQSNPAIGGIGGRDIIKGVDGEQAPDGELRETVGKVLWFGKVIGNHHLGCGPARPVDVLKGVNCAYRLDAIARRGFDGRLRGTGAQVHFELSAGLDLIRNGWQLVYDPGILVDHYPGQRHDYDQRGTFNAHAICDEVHNETLALLRHLSPLRRAAFMVWFLACGTRRSPGMLCWLVEGLSGRPNASARLVAALRGRMLGFVSWINDGARRHRADLPAPSRSAASPPRRRPSSQEDGARPASGDRVWRLPSLRSGQGAAGAVAQTVVARGLIVGLNIGTGVITARALGAEGRGVLAATVMWPQLMAWFATCGLTVSLLYNMNARRGEKRGLFTAAVLLIGVAGCFAAAIGVAIMPRLLARYHVADIRFAQLLLLTTPIVSIGLILQAAAEAERDFAAANALRVVPALGIFFGVSALFLLGWLTPHIAALVYTLAFLPMVAWLFARLRRKLRPSFAGTRRAARALVSFGLRCYPNDLLSAAAANVGQVVVVGMLDPAPVGYFVVSLSLSRVLDVVNSSVATVLLPSIAAQGRMQVTRKAAVAARLNLAATSCAALPLLALAPLLLPLVYGADFSAAGTVARLLLVEVTLTGTSALLSQAFIALGRPGIVTVLQAFGLCISTSLLLCLVPRFGAAGAAASMLGAATAKLICVIGCYKAILGVPFRDLLFQRDDLAWLKRALRHGAVA